MSLPQASICHSMSQERSMASSFTNVGHPHGRAEGMATVHCTRSTAGSQPLPAKNARSEYQNESMSQRGEPGHGVVAHITSPSLQVHVPQPFGSLNVNTSPSA
jgi:hypothetical protein